MIIWECDFATPSSLCVSDVIKALPIYRLGGVPSVHLASGRKAAGMLRLLFPRRGGQLIREGERYSQNIAFCGEYSAACFNTQSYSTAFIFIAQHIFIPLANMVIAIVIITCILYGFNVQILF